MPVPTAVAAAKPAAARKEIREVRTRSWSAARYRDQPLSRGAGPRRADRTGLEWDSDGGGPARAPASNSEPRVTVVARVPVADQLAQPPEPRRVTHRDDAGPVPGPPAITASEV